MSESTPIAIESAPQAPLPRDRPEVALAGAVALFVAMLVVLFFARVAENDALNAVFAVVIALACHALAVWVARRIDRFARA